jgi:hypothetical protein
MRPGGEKGLSGAVSQRVENSLSVLAWKGGGRGGCSLFVGSVSDMQARVLGEYGIVGLRCRVYN